MRPTLVGAIDIGSSSFKGMIAQKKNSSQEIEVLSFFKTPSFGVRKGMVVDPEEVSQGIIKLKEHLEKESQQKLKEVVVNIGGYHVFVKNTHGAIAISRADQKVSQEDIDRVIEVSGQVNLPFNKEVLEIIPKDFI